MEWRFSKTIIRHDGLRESDYQKHTKIYTFYDKKGPVGSLFYGPEKTLGPFVGGQNERVFGRFLEVGGKKYEVQNRSAFFKSIVETRSGEQTATLHFPFFSGLFGFCPKVKIGESVFKFKLVNQVNLLKKETWGAYLFELSDGRREAVVSFKMDHALRLDALFFKTNPLPMSPFSGRIEANFDDGLVFLAAFFLIEMRLVEVQEQPAGD